jgi:SET domain-containing protein
MKKQAIIKDLEENIFCRIAPSPLHGVGVFAIKPIMQNKKIPKTVKEMIKAFYAFQDGKIFCDARSFNEINISYFLNHSEKPNLDVEEINEETVFTANRIIRVGEELMVNYSKFSDPCF